MQPSLRQPTSPLCISSHRLLLHGTQSQDAVTDTPPLTVAQGASHAYEYIVWCRTLAQPMLLPCAPIPS